MDYTWVQKEDRWQLVGISNIGIVLYDKFYLPAGVMNDKMLLAVGERNGILEKFDNDVYKIYFDTEPEAQSLVEDFLEPMLLMHEMKGKINE